MRPWWRGLFATPARAAGAGALVAAAGALAWRAALRVTTVDDAYIVLRVAANWAAGSGPVFNAGERTEVATSPLWAALAAAALRLGAPAEQVLPGLGLLACAAAGAAAAALALRLAGPAAAALSCLVLASLPAFCGWSAAGLEAPLAGAAIALTCWAALSAGSARGAAATGLLTALAATARPECLALAPLWLALAARGAPPRARGRAALAGALAWALPVGLLFAARLAYYGDWLPNTYYAKAGGGGWDLRLQGLLYVARFGAAHAGLVLALLLVFARRAAGASAAAACLLFAGAVAWEGGDHFPLGRLAVPVLPLAAALAAAALVEERARAARAALALLLVAQVPASALLDRGAERLRKEGGYARQWREAGLLLRDALPPGATVATVTIGAVAFFSGHPVLDLAGLADRQIARAPRLAGAASGHARADTGYVLARAPEVVVPEVALTRRPVDDAAELQHLERGRAFLEPALQLVSDARFRERYRPRHLVTRDGWVLRVWERR